MLSPDDSRRVRFLASMSVQARRAQGMTEADIRADAMAAAKSSIEENIDDQREQETWFVELAREVDAEILRTRPRNTTPKPPKRRSIRRPPPRRPPA